MRYLVVGRFADEDALVAAVKALHEDGHAHIDAHSPFPIPELEEALELRPSLVRQAGLLFGVGSAAAAYVTMWFCNAVDFPINVGGRPLHGPPAFIPITFEMAVLGSALAIFVAFFALCRLPRLYHPAFDIDAFHSSSIDSFWASAEVEGSQHHADRLRERFESLGATGVTVARDRRVLEVPR